MMSYFTEQFPSICDKLEKELFKDPDNSRVFPPDIFCQVRYICILNIKEISKKSIYKFILSDCLFVCPFVSNKRPNGGSGPNLVWDLTYDPRENLWMLKITKISVQKFMIFC